MLLHTYHSSGVDFVLFLRFVCDRDSDDEELLTLQERQKQLLAGRSRAREEGALESTWAKASSPALNTTAAPAAAPAKATAEGATLATSGLPPRVILKPAASSPVEPVSVSITIQMCHHSSPQVCKDLLAVGYRLLQF